MADFEVPDFSRRQVEEAGKLLRCTIADDAESVLNAKEAFRTAHSWRSAHQIPMRHIRSVLAGQMRASKIAGVTAARLKRMRSIRAKLAGSPVSLFYMQDIGGCRAIVGLPIEVEHLRARFQAQARHILKSEKDYIAAPKPDGYRGVHLIFQYDGRGPFAALNSRPMLIEVQLRSKLQHAWATAVEAVGSIAGEEFKAGLGNRHWLRFFALVSSEIAVSEGCSPVPGTPENSAERLDELRALDGKLNALQSLDQLRLAVHAVTSVQQRSAAAYIVTLDPARRTVDVQPVSFGGSAEAYQRAETSGVKNSVLVEVDRATDLQAAYPNYFLDVGDFTAFVRARVKPKEILWSNATGLMNMLNRTIMGRRK